MGVYVDPGMVREYGANAALVMGQISYWATKAAKGRSRYVVDRRGTTFVAKSRESLAAEVGLTQQQLRDALERLKKAGAIRVERHLFDNKLVSHFTLPKAQIEVGQEAQTGMGHLAQTSYYKSEIEEESVAAAPQVQGKEMSKRPKSSIGSAPLKERVAAGQMQVQSTPVSVRDASKPGQLGLVWKRAWSETFEEYGGHLTPKQEKQLKLVADRCPRGGGAVIDHAVRNWSLFVATASAREGAFKAPEMPSVSFLLRFSQSAIQCWEETVRGGGGSGSLPASTAQPAKKWKVPPSSKKIVQAPSDKVTDLDEAAKLLGLD